MLKLTLPEHDDFYAACPSSPGRAGGGAVGRLYAGRSQQPPAPESWRRGELFAGLVEGLTAQQSDVEFNARLDASIQSIFEASNTCRR